jgi:RNA polymerase sigma-32 factor
MNHFTNEEQKRLIAKWKNEGNRSALELMITSNMNLIRKEASKLCKINGGIEEEDLIQEGLIGLHTAVGKYDSSKCNVFIPYALLWIRKRMKKFVVNNRSIVRLGTTNDSRKIFSSMAKVIAVSGLENATEEEKVKVVSSELGVSRKDVCQIRNILSKNDKSIDVFAESRDRALIESSSNSNSHEAFEKSELLKFFKNKISLLVKNNLNKEDKCILEGRFLSEDVISLKEIAKELNITHQAVKYREQKILLSLRKSLESDFGVNKSSFFNK